MFNRLHIHIDGTILSDEYNLGQNQNDDLSLVKFGWVIKGFNLIYSSYLELIWNPEIIGLDSLVSIMDGMVNDGNLSTAGDRWYRRNWRPVLIKYIRDYKIDLLGV